MASQAKITSFYRNAKAGSSSTILAAKRRKAVIIENAETSVQQPTKQEIPTEELANEVKPSIRVPEIKVEVPSVKESEKKKLSSKAKAASEEISDVLELKKPAIRKPRKTVKPKEELQLTSSLKSNLDAKQSSTASKTENYSEEVTSVEDSHGCSPEIKETLTPNHPNDNSASTRKRKMEANLQRSQAAVTTPIKTEEKKEEKVTPTKVRKRLDMDSNQPLNQAQTVPSSPSKQVQFICLGTLSPGKITKEGSPLKNLKTVPLPADKAQLISKSSAVKSLSSLLEKAPTKLTAEEVKSRLGKSKNLSELQAKLRKVTDCSTKVKEFQNQVQLKKFSSLEFNLEIPTSPQKQSPRKLSTAPRDAEKRPAYERYHALAQPPTSSLVLPYRYKVLAEIFRCLETVVVMLYNRKECIYFEKIKPAVQKMLQRDFTPKHLAQIVHVFPTAYKLNQEKIISNQSCSPQKRRCFQLTLTPNLDYLSSELFNDGTSPNEPSQGRNQFQPVGPNMLIERRYVFHNRLIKIVKEHHTEFLAGYNPLLVVPEHKVTRWHQNFDVDAVPDVPSADLPKPPEVRTFHTAKDVLEHAHSLVKVNPRLEAALLERAALFSKDKEVEASAPAQPEKPAPSPANPGLKGVSQSLIDKIRAREAAKAQKMMTMDPEAIRRQGMAKILPELARIISSIFVTEKKGVMPMEPVLEKVQYSYNGMLSKSSTEEHVRLIQTVIPEWLSIINRASIDYVKVNRSIDSNIVYQKLEDNAKA